MDRLNEMLAAVKGIMHPHEVWAVGGCVRDTILGKEPKDYDFTTAATPEQIEEKVRAAGRRPYLTGQRFGTVGFKVPIISHIIDGEGIEEIPIQKEDIKWVYEYVEVTTFRTEKYVKHSRKPVVEFGSSLEADLARRDFTINAIAYDGTLIDPHGGRLDLLAGLIKTVGAPKDRINEDPLRMLRAARFAAQLGFSVDSNLVGKMRQLGDRIYIVSKERWVQELDKLLMAPFAPMGIDILMSSELMKYILPEVYLSFTTNDFAYGITMASLDAMRGTDTSLDTRWLFLHRFIGLAYTEKAKRDNLTYPGNEEVRRYLLEGISDRLKFSNERKDVLLENKLVSVEFEVPNLAQVKDLTSEEALDRYEAGKLTAAEAQKIIQKNG